MGLDHIPTPTIVVTALYLMTQYMVYLALQIQEMPHAYRDVRPNANDGCAQIYMKAHCNSASRQTCHFSEYSLRQSLNCSHLCTNTK